MKIKNAIVFSDLHVGSKLGLCQPEFTLDEGMTIKASPLQRKTWAMWEHFHNDWVPTVTKGEPYIIINNGDTIDGDHHNTSTIITKNVTDQTELAYQILYPIVNDPLCAGYYHIRGTEAHAGEAGQWEEELAKRLDAKPDEIGNHARWDLWLRLGENNSLIHATHHVGTTNSAAYESTAVYKELVEAYNEAGRWGDEPPDCVIRSHRHRQLEIRIPTDKGYGIVFVTPGWQLKTPFVWRGAMGRAGTPQIGGYALREGSEDGLYTRFKIWHVKRSKEETCEVENG